MRPVDEIQQVNDRLVFWQGYEPAVKTDLGSHAIFTSQGWVIIDPIPLSDELLVELCNRGNVAAIIITSANHERSAADFRKKTGARIFAHAAARAEVAINVDEWIEEGDLVAGLKAIHLPGFAQGEIALHSPEGNGVMMVGDSLINLPPYGFAMLPDKYCEDPKVARKSLQKLLQFPFEVMTFAHGLPTITGARKRLEQLLQ